MLDWIGLLMVLGFVTLVLVLYMLITRSAGIYATRRQFWQVSLLSAGVSYLLSGSLFLFLHLNVTVAVAVSAIVPFLVSNFDLGGTSREPAPTDEGLEVEQQPADGEEDDAAADEEDEDVFESGEDEEMEEDGMGIEIPVDGPGKSEPLWN